MKVRWIISISLAFFSLLAACRPPLPAMPAPALSPRPTDPITPAFLTPVQPAPDEIVVTGLSVSGHGTSIAIDGKSSLPDGSCLLSRFFVGDQPQDWWPAEDCAQVKDGQWQFKVPLGEAGRPEALSNGLEYAFYFWWRDDPAVQSQRFYFDLQGPPPV